MDFLNLDPLLRQALAEDLGRGDITTDAILGRRGFSTRDEIRIEATLIAKEELVLAGWPLFVRVFELLGAVETKPCFEEGTPVPRGELVGTLEGTASLLLKGERVALNFLQHLCGIATLTRRYVDLVAHTQAKVLDTRKTTPLWRSLDRYAVRIGGGHNHRFGLDDGILIKENHISVAGGVREAIEACRASKNHLQKIEVEVRNNEEITDALGAGVDILLLDNMTPEQVREAVERVQGRCLVEVSGGVDETNIVQYAEAGADLVSSGILTHSSPSSDLSLILEAR
ncbi:MAG: carboxylating nicotinate-nucleotide diphosphorylase [Acidobacteriota bacterium]